MGTGEFAAASLRKLLDSDLQVVAVYTKPERSSGRRQSATNPVRTVAAKYNIPIYDPVDSLGTDENFAQIKSLAPDIIIVAAYGKILPQKVLDLPEHGCVNVHTSLLPRWRGASPIHHAILAGDTTTGVTIMRMDAGLDTGPIIAQTDIEIAPNMRTPELYTQLAQIGADLLVEALPEYTSGKLTAIAQPVDGVTTCRTLTRDDGQIDWNDSAQSIYNQFRAFTPWPGVFTYWQRGDKSIRIKLLDIKIANSAQNQDCAKCANGTVFVDENGNLQVVTENNTIELLSIQREGKSAQSAKDFLNGYPDFANAILRKI